MDILFFLLLLVSTTGLVIGLIKPAKMIWWSKNSQTKRKVFQIYGIASIVLLVLWTLAIERVEKTDTSHPNDVSDNAAPERQVAQPRALTKEEIRKIVEEDLGDMPQRFQEQKAKIAKQFRKSDGAHIKLEKLIIENMHDPQSYEHVETKYEEYFGNLKVTTKFRGKNEYGALVLNLIQAEIDYDGKILRILDNETE